MGQSKHAVGLWLLLHASCKTKIVHMDILDSEQGLLSQEVWPGVAQAWVQLRCNEQHGFTELARQP